MSIVLSRRHVLTGLAAAGAAGVVRGGRAGAAALETTSVRIPRLGSGTICAAPIGVADELLRAEGFNEIVYVPVSTASGSGDATEVVGAGAADFFLNFASSLTAAIDRGVRIRALAGIHAGCFGLFAHEGIHEIADLKGRQVALSAMGSPAHLFLAAMVAFVGIDPRRDINWVIAPPGVQTINLFVEHKSDAFFAFPPQPQELRERSIGHIIVDSAIDRPWSQYFCCLLYGNGDYVRNYPNATKAVVRAILKATDLCAERPEQVTRQLVENGLSVAYDRSLEVIRGLPFREWREHDAEDTMRFYALRLHEAGLIKSTPQKIIADGTDWRFLNELKRELKA